jgi:hypothetical protein
MCTCRQELHSQTDRRGIVDLAQSDGDRPSFTIYLLHHLNLAVSLQHFVLIDTNDVNPIHAELLVQPHLLQEGP